MSAVQPAIDGITAALQAVNWVTAHGVAVTVDSTPARVWTIAERRAGPIVYVFGGGSLFEPFGRKLWLTEQPAVFVSTMRHVGVTAGQTNTAGIAAAEAIATTALQTTRNWIVASARFAPLRFEKPERFDMDQLLKGEFLSTLALTLADRQTL